MTDQPPHDLPLFESTVSATDQVATKIRENLDKAPELHWLKQTLGGFVFNAAQKLIDSKVKTGLERTIDEVVILSCPRLFNDCFGAYLLLDRGVVVPAIVLLRSAFETTTQVLLFMSRDILLQRRESLAAQWLKGRKIAPKEVRRFSLFAEAEKELYGKLSRLAHPNVDAIQYQTVPLPALNAIALAYGGWYCPKIVGQITCQLLFAQLVFLEAYYDLYSEDLHEQGLLWRPETLGLLSGAPKNVEWKDFLLGFRRWLTELVEYYNLLPNDAINVSLHLTAALKPNV